MAILWILINVVCAVNIRGHEANFYEAEARCHEAEIEAEARKSEAEAEWFGLEALTSLNLGQYWQAMTTKWLCYSNDASWDKLPS